jgi:hypothetical protein
MRQSTKKKKKKTKATSKAEKTAKGKKSKVQPPGSHPEDSDSPPAPPPLVTRDQFDSLMGEFLFSMRAGGSSILYTPRP